MFALRDPQAADLPTAPVQAVGAGSLVASRDPATGRTGYGRVTATVSRPAPALVSLSLSDPSSGKAETLTCTPDHPLYVSGRGWVEAGNLGVGTSIVTRAGPPLVVKDVQWQRDETGKKPFTVYNLTVQGDHTYFAGMLDGGAWAHNLCDITKINELKAPGRANITVDSREEALEYAQTAFPHATQLPEATAGVAYPSTVGYKAWYRFEPAEPNVGNTLPHIKYVDWTLGKKQSGGTWGHIFFPGP